MKTQLNNVAETSQPNMSHAHVMDKAHQLTTPLLCLTCS